MNRNIFGWDYPPGAENDPNAPYNQKDPEPKECDECNGAGYFKVIEEGEEYQDKCEWCEGTGLIEIEDED